MPIQTEEQKGAIARMATARGISPREAFATEEGYQRYLSRAGLSATGDIYGTVKSSPYTPAQTLPESSPPTTPAGTVFTPTASTPQPSPQMSAQPLPGRTATGDIDLAYVPKTEKEIAQYGTTELVKEQWLKNLRASQGVAYTATIPTSRPEEEKIFLEGQKQEKSQLQRKIEFLQEEGQRKLTEQKAALSMQFGVAREAPRSVGTERLPSEIGGILEKSFNEQVRELNDRRVNLERLQEAQQRKWLASRAEQIDSEYNAILEKERNIRADQDRRTHIISEGLKSLPAGITPAEREAFSKFYFNAPSAVVNAYADAIDRAAVKVKGKEQFELREKSVKGLTDILEKGGTMTLNGLVTYAKNFDLPLDVAVSVYQGFEAIRDDKTLSVEEKKLKNRELIDKIDREQRGIFTEKAKDIDFFRKQIIQINGLDLPENEKRRLVSDLAQRLDIKTDENPLFNIEKQLKAAQAVKTEAEARIEAVKAKYAGKEPPIGSPEWVKYQKDLADIDESKAKTRKFQLENQELSGGGIAAPTVMFDDWQKSLGTITQGFDKKVSYIPGRDIHGGYDIAGKINDPIPSPISGTVSNIGLSTGKKEGYGNYVEITDNNGRVWKFGHLNQINVQQGQTVNLNQQIGSMGNSGYVEGATGVHLHVEAHDADRKLVDVKKILQQDSFDKAVYDAFLDLKLTKDEAKRDLPRLKEKLRSGDIEGAKEQLSTTIRRSADVDTRKQFDEWQKSVSALKKIQAGLDEYVKRHGDTNIFTGKTEKGLEMVGATVAPELAYLANEIATAVIDYRHAVTGAAFTPSEATEYRDIFPNIGNTPALNKVKIGPLIDKFTANKENFLKLSIGARKYETIFGKTTVEQNHFLKVDVTRPQYINTMTSQDISKHFE